MGRGQIDTHLKIRTIALNPSTKSTTNNRKTLTLMQKAQMPPLTRADAAMINFAVMKFSVMPLAERQRLADAIRWMAVLTEEAMRAGEEIFQRTLVKADHVELNRFLNKTGRAPTIYMVTAPEWPRLSGLLTRYFHMNLTLDPVPGIEEIPLEGLPEDVV